MTEKEMTSFQNGPLGLALLIAMEEQAKAGVVEARQENPRAYWLKLATECAQALGGRPSDNP